MSPSKNYISSPCKTISYCYWHVLLLVMMMAGLSIGKQIWRVSFLYISWSECKYQIDQFESNIIKTSDAPPLKMSENLHPPLAVLAAITKTNINIILCKKCKKHAWERASPSPKSWQPLAWEGSWCLPRLSDASSYILFTFHLFLIC